LSPTAYPEMHEAMCNVVSKVGQQVESNRVWDFFLRVCFWNEIDFRNVVVTAYFNDDVHLW